MADLTDQELTWLASEHFAQLRARHLAANPACVFCRLQGRETPATAVMHLTQPHGIESTFFNPANLMSLCAPCFDRATADRAELEYIRGAALSGEPLDPEHPWSIARRKKEQR